MIEKRWFPIVLATVVCLLPFLWDFALAKPEADWFYEAAQLEARFEKISSAQIPPNQKMEDYYKLLDDVKRFAVVGVAPAPRGQAGLPSPGQMSEREARGRKAFSLLATGWIQQMLANTEAANKAQAEYKKLLDSMPEQEKAIATCFLERDYQRSPVCMPRVCNVEGKVFGVHVIAVDWPLRDLLQRMADAAGVKIVIPKDVSGLVDYSDDEWRPVDTAIGLLVPARGLMIMRDRMSQEAVAPLRVRVSDPLYMASIAERVGKQAGFADLEKPEKGIETGYAVIRGHYIPAPYVMDVREKEGMVQVCINGVPVDSGRAASQPPVPQVPPLNLVKTTGEELTRAIVNRFIELKEQYGMAEAVKRLQEELNQHPMVKSAKVYASGSGADIKYPNGRGIDILFANHRGKSKDQAIEPANYRDRVVRNANERRKMLEDALKKNGLVLAPGQGRIMTYGSPDAERRLIAVCNLMQEIARCRESLCHALYDTDWASDAYDSAWEVMLNLRHRELLAKLQRDPEGAKP